MLNVQLKLQPDIEKQFIDLVNQEYNSSYELFVESSITNRKNILSKLIDIAEDLGIEDFAENHDHYLYHNKS